MEWSVGLCAYPRWVNAFTFEAAQGKIEGGMISQKDKKYLFESTPKSDLDRVLHNTLYGLTFTPA